MVIAEPLHLNRKTDGLFVCLVELVTCYGALAVNYFLQAWLLYEISGVNNNKMDEKSKCPEGLILQFVCVFIFETAIFNEVRSSMDLFSLLYYAEAGQDGYSEQGSGAVLVEEKRTSTFQMLFKKVRPTPPPGMPQWNLHDITRKYKIWSTLICALPKLMVAGLLAYEGGLFIALCHSVDDIVLNTLAVNFIVDIDEILYMSFTSKATQCALENAEAVGIEMTNKTRLAHWFCNTFVYPITVFCFSAWVVWQSVFLGCPESDAMDVKMKYLKALHMG